MPIPESGAAVEAMARIVALVLFGLLSLSCLEAIERECRLLHLPSLSRPLLFWSLWAQPLETSVRSPGSPSQPGLGLGEGKQWGGCGVRKGCEPRTKASFFLLRERGTGEPSGKPGPGWSGPGFGVLISFRATGRERFLFCSSPGPLAPRAALLGEGG